jgi:hypothetical protein
MSRCTGAALHARVTAALATLATDGSPAQRLAQLVRLGLDDIPLPAHGATLQRWQVLCAVAEHDLSLAKLYEGHTDALAVQAEVAPGINRLCGATWGMWASESPGGRTLMEPDGTDEVRLNGIKAWCSGAADVSHAVLTAWSPRGTKPQLVRVAMGQPGVSVCEADWHAIGMAASTSLTTTFHGAVGYRVGNEGAYLERPGFWHGGAGIAACWHGGAVALARALKEALSMAPPSPHNAFRLAALGRVDVALHATAALLRDAAHWIDEHPSLDASAVALRVRLAAEQSATRVLDEVGRALGATPFCRDRRFAQMAADLPVFVRQSHGERDLAALGERAAASGDAAWRL